MQGERCRIRAAIYRLLLNEEAGVAYNLVPRMLADPDSLTPEIRWCILYLVRGIRYLAVRHGLLGQDGLVDTVVEDIEVARRRRERVDWLWFTIVRDDESHWIQRYESSDLQYSLKELNWLHEQLGRLWAVERERLDLEDPPLAPLVRREKRRLKAESSWARSESYYS